MVIYLKLSLKMIKIKKDELKKQNAVDMFNQSEEDIEFYFDFDDVEGIDLDDEDLRYRRVLRFKDCYNFEIPADDTHIEDFIYLTKRGYFNGTTFHRVVPEFIIQGGNSDRMETSKKRGEIGKYLLPPDTRKGHKHHRGVNSMPSSEIENPYKLASPYEFFIVQKKDGAYHLDGDYTVFGKVIDGMETVDKIANLPTDNRDWPLNNVYINKVLINYKLSAQNFSMLRLRCNEVFDLSLMLCERIG